MPSSKKKSDVANNLPRFASIMTIFAVMLSIIIFGLLMFSTINRMVNLYRLPILIETATEECNIRIVESIPDGLVYAKNSPKFMSTYAAWRNLLDLAKSSVDIGSFYWSLRGIDVINHTTARDGEEIFNQILTNADSQRFKIRIAQSIPTAMDPDVDTQIFAKTKAAEVRSLNFPAMLGGGVLHTKLIIVDERHFYLGSANMDWRALTQVKELGVLAQNCSALSKDLAKIFEIYWYLGNEPKIPNKWPQNYATSYNSQNPMNVNFNGKYIKSVYVSSSPPPLSAQGREHDIDGILNVIKNAKRFIYIAVMDYMPMLIYEPKKKYWPIIDDALKAAAIDNKIVIKMLISWWQHSQTSEDYFLRSLTSLSNSSHGVDIEVRRFIVPSNADQKRIPFARVNHNKYMVTDNTAYIGTSNWSGDYFTNTAGIGLIVRDKLKQPQQSSNSTASSLRDDLQKVFERDWTSEYAHSFQ